MSSSLFQGLVLPDGRVDTEQSAGGSLPPGALHFRGIALTDAGKVLITQDTGQNRVVIDGIAVEEATGIVLYGTAPPTNITKGGLLVDVNGAVVMVDQPPDVIHQGVGLTDAGELCVGQLGCFYIVSAEIGNPRADLISVCFNAPPDAATCHGAPPFNFKTLDRGDFESQAADPYDFGPNCLAFAVDYISQEKNNTAGPLDTVSLDYTPGTCHKDGEVTPGDCDLAAVSDFPVTNSIWGPINLRIGDVADDILIIEFPTQPAVAGVFWLVEVNDIFRAASDINIVGNSVQITLSSPVIGTDTVTLDQSSSTDCQAVDGRYCWEFYDMPVNNVTGVSVWRREDGGRWRVDSDGNWILEN